MNAPVAAKRPGGEVTQLKKISKTNAGATERAPGSKGTCRMRVVSRSVRSGENTVGRRNRSESARPNHPRKRDCENAKQAGVAIHSFFVHLHVKRDTQLKRSGRVLMRCESLRTTREAAITRVLSGQGNEARGEQIRKSERACRRQVPFLQNNECTDRCERRARPFPSHLLLKALRAARLVFVLRAALCTIHGRGA